MTPSNSRLAVFVGLMVILPWTAVSPEISSRSTGQGVSTLIVAGAVDEIDPIGVWAQHSSAPAGFTLNQSGDARGDRRPAFAWSADGWPTVVWAYNSGTERDIAFSEWNATTWSAVEFLTDGIADDLDPRVSVDEDGTVHVVWWTAGSQQIWLVSRQPGSALWSLPVPVAFGRRPSVVSFGASIYVAYERDSGLPGMAQDVVVARSSGPANWTLSTIASTPRVERLDPILHTASGLLWVDWMHDVGVFGCAQEVGAAWWAAPGEPWLDPSWIGVEEARKAVRRAILAP